MQINWNHIYNIIQIKINTELVNKNIHFIFSTGTIKTFTMQKFEQINSKFDSGADSESDWECDSLKLRKYTKNYKTYDKNAEQQRKITLDNTTIDISHIEFPEGDKEYIVSLYISRGCENMKTSCIDVKTSVDSVEKLIHLIFDEFKYELPASCQSIDKSNRFRYIGIDDDIFFIKLENNHAYIYCSNKI